MIKTLARGAWPKICFGGFWMRGWAYLIDYIIVKSLIRLIFNTTVYKLVPDAYVGASWWLEILKLLILVVYFVGTTYYLKGQTVGKYLLDLRVEKKDGQSLDKTSLLVREVAGRALLYYWPLVAVTLVFSRQRQHFVDMLCDTVVVSERQLTFYKAVRDEQLALISNPISE